MRAPAQSLRARLSELFSVHRSSTASELKDRRREVEDHAVQVFGDAAIARDWMDSPNGALGSQRPRKLLRSAEGAEQVDVILGRIEHGIIS